MGFFKNRLRQAVIGWVGAWHAREIDPRFDAIHSRIDELSRSNWTINSALERVEPQVASLEIRLADAEFSALLRDPALTDEQRAVLLRFEDEHKRISARLQAVSHYEERVRRLEVALGTQPDR